jgi:hypothetical protein
MTEDKEGCMATDCLPALARNNTMETDRWELHLRIQQAWRKFLLKFPFRKKELIRAVTNDFHTKCECSLLNLKTVGLQGEM